MGKSQKGQKKPVGLTVIIKPTHDCNLGCKYCYVESEAESGRMDEATLRNSVRKVSKFVGKDKETHFIWHGGEPLLMGKEFYEMVVEAEREMGEGYTITNSIQSNGTLLTPEMADFFKEYEFHIGLSLDGPAEIHDRTRPYKDGRKSFRNVLRAVKLARSRKIGGGVIAILNRVSIGHLEELYDFFKENQIGLKFNPLIRSGRARENYDGLSITPKEYGEAMIRLFEMWFYDPAHKDGVKVMIDPFDAVIGNIITGRPQGCNYSESCRNNFISIGPTGAVYPCGRFDGIPEFYMGNINDDKVGDMLASPIHVKLKERSAETVKGCSPCKYKKICNAGCMHNAYMVDGDAMGKDYYCAGYKKLFGHIEKTLHKELKKAEVKA